MPELITHENFPKFHLGHTTATRTALATIPLEELQHALARHRRGDWGYLLKEDVLSNEQALRENFALRSVYHDKNGTEFWIITLDDRSQTTILLPEDR
jgi:hypothetical protein